MQRSNLVRVTADRLREMVFAAAPGALIGALGDLTASLQVGVVTLQQAARILEHEGLLEARRGPGGGYYGSRPDTAALGRSINAYLRSHPSSLEEALDITSLLFTELAAAAAHCTDEAQRRQLDLLRRRLDECTTRDDSGQFETEFLDLLCRMVDWPLFKMLILVTLQVAATTHNPLLLTDTDAVTRWREGRYRIVTAILRGDADLARFEADRSNRRPVLDWVQSLRAGPASAHAVSLGSIA